MRELSTLETYVVSGGYDPNEVDEVVVVGRRQSGHSTEFIMQQWELLAAAAELKATALLGAAQDMLEDAGDAIRRAAEHYSHLITSNSDSPLLNPNTCDPSDRDDPDCN
jgi:1-aminocyclopropane-1-carboxylate deaminase/D-cysteine desulfhydrase-like pyridoxal-dependent ACC family enzyme